MQAVLQVVRSQGDIQGRPDSAEPEAGEHEAQQIRRIVGEGGDVSAAGDPVEEAAAGNLVG